MSAMLLHELRDLAFLMEQAHTRERLLLFGRRADELLRHPDPLDHEASVRLLPLLAGVHDAARREQLAEVHAAAARLIERVSAAAVAKHPQQEDRKSVV